MYCDSIRLISDGKNIAKARRIGTALVDLVLF
ncbi:MAG: hypothetical protein ACI90V_008189, partial [Bacillariaceae sp.]